MYGSGWNGLKTDGTGWKLVRENKWKRLGIAVKSWKGLEMVGPYLKWMYIFVS